MPYRVDVPHPRPDTLDRLVELGALDAEPLPGGGLAALIPDGVAPDRVTRALGLADLSMSAVVSRDAGSVWVLSPRPLRIGRLQIVPAHLQAEPGALRLLDTTAAFGTGLHPTTALCLEALEQMTRAASPGALLDVGTGSGVLALAALMLGSPCAVGIDLNHEALRAAAGNARLNALDHRLRLIRGGPEAVTGTWPLVLANVLAATLIDMAPALVRRVAHQGHLVLSGFSSSVEPDVDQAYRRLGMRRAGARSRAGWVALTMQATW
jgi:ribosomal protein L11 methyltransferase